MRCLSLLFLLLAGVVNAQQQVVDIGVAPDDGSGDSAREAFDKLNDNDAELYARTEAFPVGAVFVSTLCASPADSLGYGTWDAFAEGRVLVGLDEGETQFDEEGETGGEIEVTLDVAEIPAHTHIATSTANARIPGGNSNDANGNIWADDAGVSSATYSTSAPNATMDATAITTVNADAGGGMAHNNLQPYLVVCMFVRTD